MHVLAVVFPCLAEATGSKSSGTKTMSNEGGFRLNLLFSLFQNFLSYSLFRFRKSRAGNRYVCLNDHERSSIAVQTVLTGTGGPHFRRADGRPEAAATGEFGRHHVHPVALFAFYLPVVTGSGGIG
jgi:hypothetical protein